MHVRHAQFYHMHSFINMDFWLFQQINNLAGQYIWLDSFGIFFAEYFEFVLIFCLFLFLYNPVKRYWQARMIFQAILAGVVSRLFFTEIIRFIIPRNRPFIENDVYQLLHYSASFAFPSGHAAFYFAISGVVYFYNKKTGIAFFIASFLICLARVFCGIHWPADIVAGFVVGVFSSYLIIKLGRLARRGK